MGAVPVAKQRNGRQVGKQAGRDQFGIDKCIGEALTDDGSPTVSAGRWLCGLNVQGRKRAAESQASGKERDKKDVVNTALLLLTIVKL